MRMIFKWSTLKTRWALSLCACVILIFLSLHCRPENEPTPSISAFESNESNGFQVHQVLQVRSQIHRKQTLYLLFVVVILLCCFKVVVFSQLSPYDSLASLYAMQCIQLLRAERSLTNLTLCSRQNPKKCVCGKEQLHISIYLWSINGGWRSLTATLMSHQRAFGISSAFISFFAIAMQICYLHFPNSNESSILRPHNIHLVAGAARNDAIPYSMPLLNYMLKVHIGSICMFGDNRLPIHSGMRGRHCGQFTYHSPLLCSYLLCVTRKAHLFRPKACVCMRFRTCWFDTCFMRAHIAAATAVASLYVMCPMMKKSCINCGCWVHFHMCTQRRQSWNNQKKRCRYNVSSLSRLWR